LEFGIEQGTAAAIPQCATLLQDIPPARLFDEFLKLFLAGYAEKTLENLLQYDLLRCLFPGTCEHLKDAPERLVLIQAAMVNTDKRIAQGKPVTPAFILAALLWPQVSALSQTFLDKGDAPMVAMHRAGQQAVSQAVQSISIPKRFSQPMREIWEFQLRLERRQGKKAAELVEHRRFRAAYDFLLLREQAGEDTGGLGEWWTEYQTLNMDQRLAKSSEHSDKPGNRRRPRRRRSNKQT
jgi:poly(A) polymerase